jgi:syntaxin 5
MKELTFIIKQDIAHINKQIAGLQSYVKQRNSQGSSKSVEGKQIEEHNHNVVMLLQSKLATTSMTFKDVLEVRTQVSKGKLVSVVIPDVFHQNMKESKDRTEQFMYSTTSAANQAPSSPLSDIRFWVIVAELIFVFSDSVLYSSQRSDPMGDGSPSRFDSKGKGRAQQNGDVLALDLGSAEEGLGSQGAFMQMQMVEQQVRQFSLVVYLLFNEKNIQDSYIQSRSTAIESIEATIAELGQIFTQLANMVAEQRETVQRIDADTMDIASNVGGAQRELLKYYASISSNRWLMLKVFGVLIVFVSLDHFSIHNLHLISYSS